MKVLFVLPGTEQGNSMIFSKRQIESLQKLGITSTAFYLQSRVSPLTLLAERKRFKRNLESFKPDIVHCHYGTMTAFFAAFSSAKPLVITYHGSDLNFLGSENFFLEIFRKLLSQVAALRAHSIICVSGKLKEKLWWRKKRTTVIPMGVDEDFFRPLDYHEVRKKLNIAEDAKLVLFNNNNPGVKRLDIAEHTISLVQRQVPSARLKILSGSITPDEILLLLNACDCLLLCSDSEGSPMMVKEAIACNLPVVSTDVGDVSEYLTATTPHVMSSPDPQMLANGIIETLKMNLRSNGRNIFLQSDLTEKKAAQKVLNIYRNILKR